MMWKRTLENREQQSVLHSLLEYPSIVIKMNILPFAMVPPSIRLKLFAFGLSDEGIDSFIYRGSVMDQQGGTDHDIKSRIGKANI